MSETERAPAITQDEHSVTRRSFLGVLLGFGTVVMGAALSVPLIRFALHPLLARTTEIGWSEVGKTDEFASLTAPAKRLRNSDDRIYRRDKWGNHSNRRRSYRLSDRKFPRSQRCATSVT